MKTKTKTKISKSLKKYHRRKKSHFDAKGMFCIGVIVFTVGFFIQALKPLPITADITSYTSFPQAEDRTDTRLVNAERIRIIAEEEGFKWSTYLVNLACHEGWLEEDTINDKGNYPADSVDRGIFGINSHWHSEVSDECAFDLDCATRWTMERINAGFQKEWMGDAFVKGKPNYINKCL